MTKTFEQVWAGTGRQYGSEELEGVRLGWDMAQAELFEFKRKLDDLRSAAESFRAELTAQGAAPPGTFQFGLLKAFDAAIEASR